MKKDGWQEEADKFTGLIEKDQAAIAAALNPRVFIRAWYVPMFILSDVVLTSSSMWHELRVVLHNRENTLVTQAVKSFAQAESVFSENASANWTSLLEGVEVMPFE